jgi:hypothetical protein
LEGRRISSALTKPPASLSLHLRSRLINPMIEIAGDGIAA